LKILVFLVAFGALGLTANAAAPPKKKAPAPPVFSQAALDAVQDIAANGPSTLQNPSALAPFFEQLAHPVEPGNVHILQYGDSHTASDDWANAMRQAFQAKFGFGGPGFALAGRPFKGYRRFDVNGSNTLGWLTDGTIGHPGDGRLGLGGIAITARRPAETVTLDVECENLQLYYMTQPDGGDFVILVDGRPTQTVSTEGDFAAAYLTYGARTGPHRYAIKTTSTRPVRLFGWAADNRAGISYETLGINGAQATVVLDWDEAVYSSNLGLRKPALIVLEYGTNEALNPRFTFDGYMAQFGQVLAKIKRAAPQASILVVGPPDCLRSARPLPHIDAVIGAQKRAAEDAGCAFWDWRARMGGSGSVRQWARAGLGQADYIHMTGPGYRLTATMLFHDLMQEYDRYAAARTE
jgi:hypothetical protein